jgi:hypothetical protein
LVAAAVGEIVGYWGHRAMHRVPCLWRLHAVHHSAPTMDWLAPNRRHVLDTALGQAASVVPLLALGLSPPVVVSAFVVRRAQGLFVHANLRVRLPGLRWVVVTPEFHHWHHSSDRAHHDRNFAGQCPIVDWLFGTLHMPAGQWPAAYGLVPDAVPVPDGYLARLRWPFRDVRLTGLRPLRAATAAFTGLAVMSSTVAVSAALASHELPGSYVCTMRGNDEVLTVEVGANHVVVQRSGDEAETALVRHVDGDTSTGLGIRFIAAGAVPMTLSIASGGPGSTVAASATSAEGTWFGSCTRGPDQ